MLFWLLTQYNIIEKFFFWYSCNIKILPDNSCYTTFVFFFLY